MTLPPYFVLAKVSVHHSSNQYCSLQPMFMETESKETKPRYVTVNFERREYPRFNIDLRIEYYRIDSSMGHTGKALNISEGGLLLHFPEQMDIGQYIRYFKNRVINARETPRNKVYCS